MSALADQLDALVSRADGYPTWARLLFLVTFVLVVGSVLVYAVEYTRLRRSTREEAPDAPPVAGGG